MEEGYEVQVSADASASWSKYGNELALWRIEQAGAVITTVDQVISELAIDWTSPNGEKLVGILRLPMRQHAHEARGTQPRRKAALRSRELRCVVCGFGIIHVPDPARGKSDRPVAIDQYTIFHLVGDLVGVLDALDAKSAVVVGHDVGESVAWQAAQMRPDRVRAVAGLSVPFRPRAKVRPTLNSSCLLASRLAGMPSSERAMTPTAARAAGASFAGTCVGSSRVP